jgi:hypothetical protein
VLPRIAGIGPGSTRIIREILETGESATVEHAIEDWDTVFASAAQRGVAIEIDGDPRDRTLITRWRPAR